MKKHIARTFTKLIMPAVFTVMLSLPAYACYDEQPCQDVSPRDMMWARVGIWAYGIAAMAIILGISCYSLRNWKKQRARFMTDTKCFKLLTRPSSIRWAKLGFSVLLVAMLGAFIWFLNIDAIDECSGKNDPAIVNFVFPLVLAIYTMFTTAIIGGLIDYLTRHICLTNVGISVESLLVNPHPTLINWKQIVSVEIHRNSALPSGISKLVVKGSRRSFNIVIPGHHLQIEEILQHIREAVPDKLVDVAPAPEQQRSTTRRQVLNWALGLAITAWVIYLQGRVFNAYGSPSTWRLYVTTIWVLGLGKCVVSLAAFLMNVKSRWESFQTGARCYMLTSGNERARAWLMYIAAEAVMAAAAVVLSTKAPSNLSFVQPALTLVVLMTVVLGTLKLVHKLTTRLCLSDEEVCTKSLVAGADETHIKWDLLTSVDVQYSASNPDRVKKVVLNTGPGGHHFRSITISGRHAEIDSILRDIHEKAPDKYGNKPDRFSKMMPGTEAAIGSPGLAALCAILAADFLVMVAYQSYDFLTVLIWVLCILVMGFPVGFVIVKMTLMLIEGICNWQTRWHQLTTDENCYRVSAVNMGKTAATILLVAYELVFIYLLVWLTIWIISEPRQIMQYLVYVSGLAVMAIMIPLDVVFSLTAHYCITDLGISIEGAVEGSNRRATRWDELTKVEVKYDDRNASRIRSIVLESGTGKRPIVISGNHPDVKIILQYIREHAPEYFE
ncbi:MAG: hypothetical protein ACYC1M_17040 [Armatimonadota bacterium]